MASSKSGSKTGSRRKTTGKSTQDAIALLKADHTKVQGLFDQFEKARTESRKQSLAQEICMELKVHTTIEEEIFYPAAREAIDDSDLLDEAAVEHQSAKELIAQIEEGSPADDMWSAKVTVLGEYIKHHVKEEQNELFPEVRSSDVDLKALGQQLLERKQELMSEFKSKSNGASTRSQRSASSAAQSL
ncbi:MAG TPA: hemerythrin domain-containing protein [Steroidobacteraceae bacterium]|jgi:hemerythrin superfamily protein|nr:hemerythrin domain-containing protein [Steroidobacteraceae bacterium]